MSESGRVAGRAFICYGQDDAARADELQAALAAAGITVWRDAGALLAGEDKRRVIRRAITGEALAFLACFSRLSLARAASGQNEELGLAVEELRRRLPDRPWLIPVRFDECAVPDIDIGFGRTLAALEPADLFGAARAENAARLVAAIRAILEREAAGPPDAAAARALAGPREAAREAARALSALDDSCRFGGALDELVARLLDTAARQAGQAPGDEAGFRARARAHGLDPRLLIPGMPQHREAVRRWLAPAAGGIPALGRGDAPARALLAALSAAARDAVLGGQLGGLSDGARRYLGAALGAGSVPGLEDFTQGLASQLPPLRSASREAVLARPGGIAGTGEAGEEDAGRQRRHGLRLSGVARQMCGLPLADPHVTGRADQAEAVSAAIREVLTRRGAATAVLSGQPGVGTSTVAVAAARGLIPDFPGGVLYVDLHGLITGARRDARTVARIVSEALGLDLAAAAGGDDLMLTGFARQLARLRVLLVLDNARDAAHVARLTPAPPGCAIIVTSRDQLQDYADPELVFRVGPLDRAASVRLLAGAVAGRAHDGEHLAQIAALCADVPLALRVMRGRIASRPDLDLAYHLRMLSAQASRLSYLEAGDRAVRTAIQLSYDLLDPPGRRLLRLMPAVPGSSVTGPDLGQVLGGSPVSHELSLSRLADRSLAAQSLLWLPTGDLLARFTPFDLIRIFAMERLLDEVPAAEIRDFRHRYITLLRDQLTGLTDQADDAEVSGELDPARFHAAEALAEQEGWLDLARDLASSLYVIYRSRKELDSVVAVNEIRVRLQLKRGDYDQAACSCLDNADDLQGLRAAEQALAAARRGRKIAADYRLPARVAEADFRISLLLGARKEWKAALAASSRAVEQATRLHQEAAAVDAAINNSAIAHTLGDRRAMATWSSRATELADRWGTKGQQALAALRRGRAEALLGNPIAAVFFARRAEALFTGLASWWNAGVCAEVIALAAADTGDTATAADSWARAAGHWARDGDTAWQVMALINLSALHVRGSAPGRARAVLGQALAAAGSAAGPAVALLRQEVLVRQAALRVLGSPAAGGGGGGAAVIPAADGTDPASANSRFLRDLRDYTGRPGGSARLRTELLGRLGMPAWNPPPGPEFTMDTSFGMRPGAGTLS